MSIFYKKYFGTVFIRPLIKSTIEMFWSFLLMIANSISLLQKNLSNLKLNFIIIILLNR